MPAPDSTRHGPAAPRRTAPAMVAVFLLVGAVCLGFGGWCYLRERAFLSHGVHVTGRVTDMTQGYQPKVGHTSQPVFEFTDASGTTFTVESHEDDYPCHIGDAVPVIYDPDDPAKAQLGGLRASWDATFILGGFGVLFFGGGIVCAWPYLTAFRAARAGNALPSV